MSRALLAKLFWHVLSNRESVWCRLLWEKYEMRGEDDVHFREKTRSSLIWKGIIRGSGLLKKGMKWRAINWGRIYFWLDAWLEDSPLCEVAVTPIGEDLKQMNVRDYWLEEEGWKWDQLKQILPPSSLQKLSSLQLQNSGLHVKFDVTCISSGSILILSSLPLWKFDVTITCAYFSASLNQLQQNYDNN